MTMWTSIYKTSVFIYTLFIYISTVIFHWHDWFSFHFWHDF